ncbi:hypothetical protein ED236_02960 [Pseudomethylobacillus aquaticus]|uniref:Uncharacterized protein n=1 Tax=Pseudomethylobacillus aquaticus TaxID=2676064 RepID=A0A3N0V7S9_9PROT|nr:PD40 domain-containing protein [Pseudomethylobacillus aquaticus]ROH88428.1 hypothetical protein ED236_02960 [Pseudomethylobacillus aquaticus]
MSIKTNILILYCLVLLLSMTGCNAKPTGMQLTANPLSISSDGRYILYGLNDNGNYWVQRHDVETSQNHRYTPAAGFSWDSATFAPDDRSMAIIRRNLNAAATQKNWSDGAELALVNVDGSNLKQLTHDGGIKIFPTFSRDGSKIYYFRGLPRTRGKTPASQYDLWVYDLEKSTSRQLTNAEFYSVNSVATYDNGELYISATPRKSSIYRNENSSINEYILQVFADGKLRTMGIGGFLLQAKDTNKICYVLGENNYWFEQELFCGLNQPQKLTNLDFWQITGIAASSNGHYLAMAVTKRESKMLSELIR